MSRDDYRDDYRDRDRGRDERGGGDYRRGGGEERGMAGPRDPPTGCSLLVRNLAADVR